MCEDYMPRVELHCHSCFSKLEGVSTVEDIIYTARANDMPAVAIMDYMSVSGFTEAEKCANMHDEFKMIYGMEANIVNDVNVAVENPQGQALTDDYVVIDFETTGVRKSIDEIIEVGAVRVAGGRIVQKYQRFINIGKHVPDEITELTGITDSDLQLGKSAEVVMGEFVEFCHGAYLVGHNVSFDSASLKRTMEDCSMQCNFTFVDSLAIAYAFVDDLESGKLSDVARTLGINTDGVCFHRASGDAEITAYVYMKLIEMMKDRNIRCLSEINEKIKGNVKYVSRAPFYCESILVKNAEGKRNLYELLSDANLKYNSKYPKVPLSQIFKHNGGLLFGSGGKRGRLYQAIQNDELQETIDDIAKRYDYLEVQPVHNLFYPPNDELTEYDRRENHREINRKIIESGKRVCVPVVATGDADYVFARDKTITIYSDDDQTVSTEDADAVAHAVLMDFRGWDDEHVYKRRLKTTAEMLEEFSYLGRDKAWEIVVENSNHVADRIEVFNINPCGGQGCMPVIEGANQTLRHICEVRLKEIYGESVDREVLKRLDWELGSLAKTDSDSCILIVREMIEKSGLNPYEFGFRGTLGSLLTAFLSGITCINPIDSLMPFHPEFLLGIDGNKLIDIDLNFPSEEVREEVLGLCNGLNGVSAAVRAGTYSMVSEKMAYSAMKEYEALHDIRFDDEIKELVVERMCNVFKQYGQHPGGVILIPEKYRVYDFTPLCKVFNEVSAIEFCDLDNLYKLDILVSNYEGMTYSLMKKTGVSVSDISLEDSEVIRLFQGRDTFNTGIKGGIDALGVPVFNTSLMCKLASEYGITKFTDIVKIIGMAHGTGVWTDNAGKLIADKVVSIDEVPAVREDIYDFLIRHRFEKSKAYLAAEYVWKGKAFLGRGKKWDIWKGEMQKMEVPEWFIKSCEKIQYMFPRAHAYRYALSAWWCAWFKLHYPQEFYETYFEINSSENLLRILKNGVDSFQAYKSGYEDRGGDEHDDPWWLYTTKDVLAVAEEMFARNIFLS